VPRFGRVVLGGTFDRLHVGHEALLATAFRHGRTVAIGLTTDGYLARHPKPGGGRIAGFAARRRALVRWLSARYPRRRWTVVPLENPFGRSVEPGVDALVVSADTVAGGRAVNAERRRRGRSIVPLIVVPLVLGDDLQPVSSRRIRAGEIDRRGHRVGRILAAVRASDPDDAAAVARGIHRAFARAVVVPTPTNKRRTSIGAAARAELTVTVRGRRPWRIDVRAPGRTLPPLRADGRRPRDLARAVATLLRSAPRPSELKRRRR
jgi:pantetheine-phosphate adenylyltransferase